MVWKVIGKYALKIVVGVATIVVTKVIEGAINNTGSRKYRKV